MKINKNETNIIIRLDLCSKNKTVSNDINLILEQLPETPKYHHLIGAHRILNNNNKRPTTNKRTTINFEYPFITYSLDEACKQVITQWIKHSGTLKNLRNNYEFKAELNFELTIANKDYPSIIFSPDLLNQLKQLEWTISFTFYEE